MRDKTIWATVTTCHKTRVFARHMSRKQNGFADIYKVDYGSNTISAGPHDKGIQE